MTTFEGREKLVERLKSEAGQDFEAGQKAGRECAFEWAVEFAAKDDLRRFGEESSGPNEADMVWGFLAKEYDAYFDDDRKSSLLDGVSNSVSFSRGFGVGFIGAVQEIWNDVYNDV
jgi:hypothetical protein